MIKILRTFALVFVAIFSLNIVQSGAQSATQRYADSHRNIAATLALEYGIPREVILGVAAIESSSGQAKNCRDLNNHFGIVGSNNIARHTRYKQYASTEESFRDFCKLMVRKGFYLRLKGNNNPTAWAEAISKCGYSEQPGVWKQRVVTIMKTNRL